MRFSFSEEQEEIRRAARSFLSVHSSTTKVREAMATERGYDADVWRRVGAELGLASLLVPEAYGGAGLSHVELAGVMEEMGKALFCGPFFSSVCLCENALLTAGNDDQKGQWLPALASGETTGTLAHLEASGRLDASGIESVAKKRGGDYVLTGEKSFVIDGHTEGVLIVAAREPGSSGEEGVGLFVVPTGAHGLTRSLLPTMDATRKQARIQLVDVVVPGSARLGGEGDGWRLLQQTLALAAIALSAEQVGGAETCLSMAVEYAKVRVQFGRAIGSFQAVKHTLADLLVLVESARSASYYAAWVAAEEPNELAAAASLAKATCSEAYFRCAAENIQVHGGIGFTWEHDAHLYFKRAKSSEILLGDPTYHRGLFAARIGL